MPEDFPPPERPDQKGQASKEAQVRSHQAYGALPREARGWNKGKEGRGSQEQAYWEVRESKCFPDREKVIRPSPL